LDIYDEFSEAFSMFRVNIAPGVGQTKARGACLLSLLVAYVVRGEDLEPIFRENGTEFRRDLGTVPIKHDRYTGETEFLKELTYSLHVVCSAGAPAEDFELQRLAHLLSKAREEKRVVLTLDQEQAIC
jgi:hypothetical protein